jgi:orotidine-5'-phosphate decarboxylase
MKGVFFLVPGFGAQGGSLDTVRACFDEQGKGAIVNSARAVMYPHKFGGTSEPSPKDAVRKATQELVAAIRGILRTVE